MLAMGFFAMHLMLKELKAKLHTTCHRTANYHLVAA